jgi:Fe-S cluster biogenesis protein NfuA
MSDDRLPFDGILPRIAELAETLSAHSDPAVVAATEELLDWIDAFHLQGIGTLIEMIREWRGEIFLDSVAEHPVTGLLLSAYGLGTVADESAAQRAVQAAMNEVRPYIDSHGGAMEVTSIRDGIVGLRLHGTCDGCTGLAATIAERIDVALRTHWIDFRRVETEDQTRESHPPPTGQNLASSPVPVQISQKTSRALP